MKSLNGNPAFYTFLWKHNHYVNGTEGSHIINGTHLNMFYFFFFIYFYHMYCIWGQELPVNSVYQLFHNIRTFNSPQEVSSAHAGLFVL